MALALTPLRVLLVDDSGADAMILVAMLQRGGFESSFTRVDTAEQLRETFGTGEWDIVLSDYVMPHLSGLDVIQIVHEIQSHIPVIVVSGKIGEDTAVEALHAGACDYVMKGNLTRLAPAVHRALEESRLRREREQVEAEYRQAQKMESIGRLAGGVAHDFNNILTVVTGYSELVMARLSKTDPSYMDLQEIRRSAEQ